MNDELAASNEESWRVVERVYSDSPDMSSENYFRVNDAVLLPIVRQILSSPDAKRFRAGIQMSNLLISTKNRHGLEVGDPYIRMYLDYKDLSRIRLIYYDRDDHEDQYLVPIPDATPILVAMLARLWAETHPDL